MNSPHAGAGQKGNGQLRNHRQVEGNPVTLFHSLLLQDICKAADLGVEHLVCIDLDILFRLSLPDDSRLVAPDRR